MQDILYTNEEKDFLYLLVYNYLKYGKYEKAVTVINGLPFHSFDAYLLKCLMYGQMKLGRYQSANLTITRLREIDANIEQDGWFTLMQSILTKQSRQNSG